jgi:heptosyltransferase-2
VTKRVLIVGPAWVGDMVMAQSLFITLQQSQADVQIDVVAPAWSAPLLKRMPQVNDVIPMPLSHGEFGFNVRRRLGISLRARQYNQAIILPRSFKAAITPYFARIPRRTGFRGEMRYGLINDMRVLDKSVLIQTVQRFVALGLERNAVLPPDIPYPKLEVDEANQSRVAKQLGLDLTKPAVGIMPGAEYGPAKQWPIEYYAELAKRLAQQGLQVWQFGSEKERPLGDKIARLSQGATINLCGKTRLEDVIDLVSLTQYVITNDSGLMHVAAAVDIPVVAIYGSSTPSYTPPLTDKAVIHYLNLECSPCFERTCPLGHMRCLKDIGIDQVVGRLPDVPLRSEE